MLALSLTSLYWGEKWKGEGILASCVSFRCLWKLASCWGWPMPGNAGRLEEKTRGESGAFLLSCPPMSQWDFLQQWCFLHRSSSLGTDLRWFQLPLGGPTSFLFTKVVKDPAVANLLVAPQVVGQLVFQKCPRHSACQDSQNMLTCPGSRVSVAQMSVW